MGRGGGVHGAPGRRSPGKTCFRVGPKGKEKGPQELPFRCGQKGKAPGAAGQQRRRGGRKQTVGGERGGKPGAPVSRVSRKEKENPSFSQVATQKKKKQ